MIFSCEADGEEGQVMLDINLRSYIECVVLVVNTKYLSNLTQSK